MRTHRIRTGVLGVLGLLSLDTAAVWAGSKQSKWVKNFVPPTPAPPAAPASIDETPEFDSRLFARELPMLLPAAVPASPHIVEGEIRLRRAEEHFRKGSELAARHELDAAKLEFDAALEQIAGAPPTMPERARLLARYQTLVDEIYGIEKGSSNAAAGESGQPVYDKSPVDEIAEQTFAIDSTLEGKVKGQLKSTVSQLPLEIQDPVLGFINYFSGPRGQQIVAAGMRRAGRWAPMIRRILDEEGVPQEFIYLAQAESGFLPRAVSHKAATGMWQFVQFRGREYGLNQTGYTDDRLDPEKATRAAARHLRDLYHEFGDWYLAVAAYNCGPLAVERGVQRTGYADFWELYKRNVLPRETANYLPIILALTIMAKNPKDYGLDGIVPDAPLEYDTIRMTANTHLALLADMSGRTLQQIQELNPSILRLIAPPGYEVHVPKGTGRRVLSRLEYLPAEHRADWRVHRVSAGETLASISRRYSVRESAVNEANQKAGLDASLEPEEGDLVLVPASYPGAGPDPSRRPASSHHARRKPAAAKAKNTPSRKPLRAATRAPSRPEPTRGERKPATVSSLAPRGATTLASARVYRSH